MVLASPGPLLIPPPSSSPPKTPFRSYSATTPLFFVSARTNKRQQHHYGNPTPPSPGGRGSSRWGRGMGGQNGPTQTCSDTPATARLRRGRPLMTLQPTKRQPATVGAVERGGRVTTARQTTTRAVPGFCTAQVWPAMCAAWRALFRRGEVWLVDFPSTIEIGEHIWVGCMQTLAVVIVQVVRGPGRTHREGRGCQRT